MRQHPDIVLHEAVGDVGEGGAGEVQEILLPGVDVYQQELPHLGRVGGGQDGLEQRVALFGLALAAEAHVAADEHDDGDDGPGYHYRHAAKVHQAYHHPGAYEGDSGGDEPAADDGDDAGDTEDGAFAPPGAVGKRRAHGHHEGDEGGG